MQSVVVFCGSSEGNEAIIVNMAASLGTVLAKRDLTIVYGGAKIGLMGKVAQAALDANGKVIGVIPSFLKKREVVHLGLSELITTTNMHERKLKMFELSDGIIMLPGGFGTLEEFFEMLTWAQLGLHQKPIGILNTNGFYDELLQMLQKMVSHGFLKKENYDMVLVQEDADSLVEQMEKFLAKSVTKYINKSEV